MKTPIPISNQELAWRDCQRAIGLNPLAMPQYYNTLFSSFKNLMLLMGDRENYTILTHKIQAVEQWLSDEYNQLSLRECEMRMWNNMDLLSGFLVNGVLITQMEINEKLENIKQWLFDIYFQYMQYIRFTIQVQV